MNEFIPSVLIFPFIAYAILQHEMAEWGVIRSNGIIGSSIIFGILIDVAAGIMGFYGWLLYILYAYNFGWKAALGLYIISFISSVAFQFIAVLYRNSKIFVWAAMLPCFYCLALYLSYKIIKITALN